MTLHGLSPSFYIHISVTDLHIPTILSPSFYIHISVTDLYITTIGLPIWLQQNKSADPGI
jgi:hypothetical protein